MSEEQRAFGARLEQFLKDQHMTQKELAEKAQVTEAAVSHYIKGDRTPRSSVLARIALALGTTSEFLMEGIPQKKQEELVYARRIIARNVGQMSKAEKIEFLKILMGDHEDDER